MEVQFVTSFLHALDEKYAAKRDSCLHNVRELVVHREKSGTVLANSATDRLVHRVQRRLQLYRFRELHGTRFLHKNYFGLVDHRR